MIKKISLIQINSNGTLAENKKKLLSFLKETMKNSPDIICLFELFLAWGNDFDNIKLCLEDIKDYQNFAKNNNVNIILGSIPLKSSSNNKMTNTSFVINRNGDIVGQYNKKYMYTYNGENFKVNETDDTIPGTKLGIFEIDDIKIGVGICFDLRFPEYFRELTKAGAEVIFLPSHFRENTGKNAWNILPEARAIENQVFFCACNQTGDGLVGNSKVISYDGTIISSLEESEDILNVELDLEEQKEFRKIFPLLEQI